MTKAEIIARLTELGVEFSESATKAELEELLRQAEQSAVADAPEEAADSPALDQTTQEEEESDELLDNPEQFENDDAEPSDDELLSNTEQFEDAEGAEQAEEEPEETPEEESEPETVKVLVGPNGEAGRIIVNRIAIDTRTPGVITMREYKALRRRYDLRIVEPEEQ